MGRNFNVPSGEMLTQSRAVRLIFMDDKAEFTGLDPAFLDPFADDWLASIEASEAYPTDEYREDVQMEQTAEVLADMKTARSVVKTAKYFIEKAFATKPEAMRKFGLDDYDEAIDNQSRMTTFLTALLIECKKPANEALLLAEGMTNAQIDDIKDIRNKFAADNAAQDQTILTTQDATRDRNNQYNSTFEFWQKVNRASKVIFEDDVIKLNEYKLPEGPQPDPDINLKGKVLDALNNTPLKNVVVKISELDIETTTNYAGNFSFVSLPAGTYTVRFVLPGYVTQDVPVTILASGVVVQNVSLAVA